MKSYVFEKPGIENLKKIDEDKIYGSGLKVRILKAALNPLDYNVIAGNIVYGLNPLPHIAGSEAIGELLEDGKNMKKGQRVIIYNRIYDSTCRMCREGREYLCLNGGIWGVMTNGAFTEEVRIEEKNLVPIPEYVTDIQAVSIPIAALTPYHALRRAGARAGEKLLIYGASGNTGILGMQFGNLMGLDVYAVSNSPETSTYGALEVFPRNGVPDNFTADVVINPLGKETWEDSLKHTSLTGRIVTFGVLTGREGITNIPDLYTKEKTIIGSTGGSLNEVMEILHMMKYHQIRIGVDRVFPFDELPDALIHFAKGRKGRVIIDYEI
ncbi:alcohol dehydrogenase catalytic domain-containing protein [Cuniculiplasma sp. SKW3]|uniref:alcohol dehydrogenase catalytic domain-containing protein n=1 Tax=Cuniculiplasma sp. SKW3 TaxID=3400170 RepID=UPI003FD0C8D5